MRKKEIGQAFIMVLILLGIGALLVVPSLRLTGTSLKSGQVVERQIKGLYAADAAQEYILWKLLWGDLAGDLMLQYDPEFPDEPPSVHYDLDVCGVPAGVTVVMRAKEGEGGMVLATDDKIRPTKTVKCGDEEPPDEIPNDWSGTVTYTIRLEYLSDDDPTVGLDAIYDILPIGFKPASSHYVDNSSYLRVDGGEWQWIPDPDVQIDQNQYRLLWPADYNYQTREGAFSSHPEFYGIEDFEVRQVKEIKFQVEGSLPDNSVQSNWVVLKMGDEDNTSTLSGPQAPITVGSPANPGVYTAGALFEVTKFSNPEVIPPGEPVDIEYTISIKNVDGTVTHHIASVTDFLPFGFTYIDGSTSGITIEEPVKTWSDDIERWVLTWEPGVQLLAGETKTLTFWAHTDELDVSGSYYNEFIAVPSGVTSPKIFFNIGILAEEFMQNYSWNTGAVIVPAYDSSSEAEGITIDANMSLIIAGITITSWQVD